MLNEQQFEELLQIVIPEVCYEEICEIEEQMLKEGKHVFSEEFEKNMESVFKEKKSISNDVTAIKRKTKPKFKYLLVAILLFILSSITVLAYEPARHALKDFFFTIYNEYIIFNSENNNDKNHTEMIILKPSYIPDRYELIDKHLSITNKSYSLMWISEIEEVLLYQQMTTDSGHIILTSDGSVPQDIKIGKYDGKITTEEGGITSIFYENQGCLYTISGVLEKEELVNILLSIND